VFHVQDYPAAAMKEYAAVRVASAGSGRNPGVLDAMIAAHALHIGATLVTNDGDFAGIPGLETVNWLAD
jgi:predicted nucleic acid-binding protein